MSIITEDFDIIISGEDIIACPRCGARTDFNGDATYQIHECMNKSCGYRFAVEFEDEEAEEECPDD